MSSRAHHDELAVLIPVRGGIVGHLVTGSARLVGAGLLVAIGLIHLVLAPQYAQAAGYVGALFYATCVGAWVTAAAVVVGVRFAWMLGGLIAASAFGALLLSVTVGLPSFQDTLDAPWAVLSLTLEGAFVGFYLLLAMIRRSPTLAPR